LVLIHGCIPVDEFKGLLLEFQIGFIGHVHTIENLNVHRGVSHHIINQNMGDQTMVLLLLEISDASSPGVTRPGFIGPLKGLIDPLRPQHL
jgi:hypothetical protein